MKTQLSAQQYIERIEILFRKNGNPKRAEGAAAYMRNQFYFFGISTPDRRALQKEFHSKYSLPPIEQLDYIVHALWNKPQRELHYFALELIHQYRKQFKAEHLPLFEYLITTNSWWDTVDVVAPKLAGALFIANSKLAEKTALRWMRSDNMWLNRAALICQLNFKEKTNSELLFRLIRQLSNHPDFFIRKAIGWSLRQYARTNPKAVKLFLKDNASILSPLSLKEAGKNL